MYGRKSEDIVEDNRDAPKEEENKETILDITKNIIKLSAELRKLCPLTRKQKLFEDLESIFAIWQNELDYIEYKLDRIEDLEWDYDNLNTKKCQKSEICTRIEKHKNRKDTSRRSGRPIHLSGLSR